MSELSKEAILGVAVVVALLFIFAYFFMQMGETMISLALIFFGILLALFLVALAGSGKKD